MEPSQTTSTREPGKRLNSRAIAAAAGVSQATVSNVLNHPDVVAPATYQKVMAVMESLDFVPNRSARDLRAGGGSALGLIVLDISNPFWGELVRGAEEIAAAKGQPVIVCSSEQSAKKEEQFLRLLESHQVSAVLIAPVAPDSPALRGARRRGTKLVFLDHAETADEVISVGADDVQGARLAAEHLLANGHRQVAFVNGPHSISACRDRARGFLQAYAQSGTDAHVTEINVPAMTGRDGLAAVEAVLEVNPSVSAVFCANDMLALGVLRGLSRRGVRVPEHVSLVGYDDSEFAEVLSPALTTVRIDPFEIGREAARIALEASLTETSPAPVILEPRLMVRESVAPIGP
ncbi:LacI family DNA-binding transcriptional regulator [Sinomonas gamaensis]|uniref:LacI family DNA-binding transcriptional regulator n=1 Tax=Sinomonas gamaensis TaxID=2565624 RepID=UPI0011091D6B|nr:LacI family DNA-binding transcriptional regulator [Sinomonas gamaensis]